MFFTQRLDAFQFHFSCHRSFAIFVEKQTVYIEEDISGSITLILYLVTFSWEINDNEFLPCEKFAKKDGDNITNRIIKLKDNFPQEPPAVQ